MPNWNNNSVTIHAPTAEVETWLEARPGDTYLFNMHRLYPEVVPSFDPTGELTWDYDWFVNHTGSKWTPEVHMHSSEDGQRTHLDYDTARAPNNLLLERLHEMTGWYLNNEYEEPGVGFEGTFVCSDGECITVEGDYRPLCVVCDEKKPYSEFTADPDVCTCDTCMYADPISLTP